MNKTGVTYAAEIKADIYLHENNLENGKHENSRNHQRSYTQGHTKKSDDKIRTP